MQKAIKSRNHGLVVFNPEIGPLTGATTPGQRKPGSNGITQSSSFTGISPLDCLVSCQDTHWRVLPLCRGAVGVFYSRSRLSNFTLDTYLIMPSVKQGGIKYHGQSSNGGQTELFNHGRKTGLRELKNCIQTKCRRRKRLLQMMCH